MDPTVTLLSHTAYPLETLYLMAVTLDYPEIPFNTPEEIHKLLYTPLSENLSLYQKQFILGKMRSLVRDTSDPLTERIEFIFIVKELEKDRLEKLIEIGEEFDINRETNTALWYTSLGNLFQCYRPDKPDRLLHVMANKACDEIRDKVNPHLYELLTAI